MTEQQTAARTAEYCRQVADELADRAMRATGDEAEALWRQHRSYRTQQHEAEGRVNSPFRY